MSSAWGRRAEILKYFGWTYDYLLWGISWLNVSLMLADGARYEAPETGSGLDGEHTGPVIKREIKGKKAIMDYVKGII